MNLLKKIVCFCFLVVFCSAVAWGQCPNGNLALETQAQVDDFGILYPDCTEIEGDLYIGKLQLSTDITDLSPLNQIMSVGGSLTVRHNPNLSNLGGLENLSSIGDNISIEFNDDLMSLSSLGTLTSIDGNLRINDNDNLINLNGLDNVTLIGGYLFIANNISISLIGLESLTSIGGYVWMDNNSALIDFSGLENLTSIEGFIEIEYNNDLINFNGLGNLTSIGGDVKIDRNRDLINLSGLESLTLIGEDIYIQYNEGLMSLSGLENMTSIEGNMQIKYNDNLLNVSGLDNVTSFDGNLFIQNNASLNDLSGLANVTSVGGFLSIRNDDSLVDLSGLENLISVGNLQIENNESLNNLASLANIISVGSFLDIQGNPNLTSLSGLENLTSIEGDLHISSNNLNDLKGIENITSIEGDLWIGNNNNLINLSGLENLTSLGNISVSSNDNLLTFNGLENLTVLGNLNVEENDNLLNLNGLEKLTSIGGSIDMRYNPNLLDLNSLINITSIAGNLHIEGNTSLSNLNGLQSIDYNTIQAMYIADNSTLSICSFPPICGYIENGTGFTYIGDNASGCSSETEVMNACSYIPRIQADVFYDVNQNKTQDTNEPNYYDVSILIEPDDNSYYTPNNGIFYLEPGSYTAIFDEANNPNWQLTTDVTSYSLNLAEGDVETITFGIYPTQQISHIQTIINSRPARCNETIILDVTTKNLGTTIASGTIWLTIDDAIPEFNFIHQPDTIVEGSIITYYGWYFTDLYPGQTIIKNVEVAIPGPLDFQLGERLLFVSFSEFTDVNGEDGSEGFRYNPEVLCSYDPNDKLVNPNREGDYVLFEEDLIYTIRFQNTGNDVAYDVVIRDTLDANLDHSTFRLLGSSHAGWLNTTLSDEGILTFEFRDIFLPDSTSNFEASQGYVNYLIHTTDGLAEETPVTNSAGIYFDLNPPVITNTTQSIMVSELPTVSTETPDNSFNFNVLPNPNSGVFAVQNIPTGTYQILNTSGQIIRQGDMKNDLLIDISREAQGVYFISITVDDTTLVRRIVKM